MGHQQQHVWLVCFVAFLCLMYSCSLSEENIRFHCQSAKQKNNVENNSDHGSTLVLPWIISDPDLLNLGLLVLSCTSV